MSTKKGTLPELLFVHPIGHVKHKIRHKHVMFLIEEWDELGRPKKLTLLPNEDAVDVGDIAERGAEFMSGYIQGHMTDPRPDKQNKKAC